MTSVSILPHTEGVAALATRGSDDVIITVFKLPLIDRYSLARLVVPCRGATCQHHEAFELSTYEYINRDAAVPLCPICSEPTPPQSLRVEELVLRLLQAAPGAAEVILTPDGQWQQQRESGEPVRGVNSIDLTSDGDEDNPINIADDDDDPIKQRMDNEARTTLFPLKSLPPAPLPSTVTVSHLSHQSLPAGSKRPRPDSPHRVDVGGSSSLADTGGDGGDGAAHDLATALCAMSPPQLCQMVSTCMPILPFLLHQPALPTAPLPMPSHGCTFSGENMTSLRA